MGEVEGQELSITAGDQSKDAMSPQLEEVATNPPDPSEHRGLKWWFQIAVYVGFTAVGQVISTLLGRLYYEKGGKSVWLMTLLQFVGFPVILPLYYVLPLERTQMDFAPTNYALKASSIYIFLGLFSTAVGIFYSIGLKYLPVSTFTLIGASQLAFNALFSYLLTAQKFTPYIVNSLVLLTISSTLLVFNSDSSLPKGISKLKYKLGFIFAIANSAGYGLFFTLTQLAITRVLKNDSLKTILDMIVYESAAASLATVVGFFASGEWKTLRGEMDWFELGKASYLMTLIGIALTCQMFTVGLFGLIVKVSALFSNVVAIFGLPIAQVLAVVFFHDSMNGIKVVSTLLAIWGFASYAYQQYLDQHRPENRSPTTG